MTDRTPPPPEPFEQQLARALRRVEVPAGVARKLDALAADAERLRGTEGPGPKPARPASVTRVFAFPGLGSPARSWMAGALAAVLLVSVAASGVHLEHRHQAQQNDRAQQGSRSQQAIEAQRDFDTAERIEDQTLQQVRRQMAQAGVPLN